MWKKIGGTIGTRYFVALLNLALIFINARTLGVEGIGWVGLVVASVNIVVIFNGILCGNTIVYFMNRYPTRLVFCIAYVWALVGSALATGGLALAGWLPEGEGWNIYLLALLNSAVAANSRFLLGKERIKGFNLTFLLQGGLLFFVLLYFYFGVGKAEAGSYIKGLYITNGVAFLVSLRLLAPYLIKTGDERKNIGNERKKLALYPLLKEMFAYGLWAGADNLAEVCTTRVNYFLMERFGGLGSVGLLDAGTKMSESVWHINRSVGFIAYERVASSECADEQCRVTLRLFKLTVVVMTLVMGGILLIPEWVYTGLLFDADFKGIRGVIIALSAGIVALGGNSILSQYFIGSGRVRLSTASSCVGLASLLASGSWLIPAWGVVGAAISASIAYSAMLLFSLLAFVHQTGSPWRAFLPSQADWREIRDKVKRKSVSL